MLDLTQDITEARLTLNKMTPKRSGGDDNDLLCVLEFVSLVTTEEQAEIVDRAVPGALALWKRSQLAKEAAEVETELDGAAAGSKAASGTFGRVTVKVPNRDRRALVSRAENGRVVRLDCEIQSVSYKATPKVSVFTFKIVAHGIDGIYVGWLASMLDEVISMQLETLQTSLVFGNASLPDIGQIVSGIDGGKEYAGEVLNRSSSDEDGQMLEIVDLDGEPYLVRAASVSGCINVPNAEAFLADRNLAGVSWTHVVVALGQEYLAEGSPVADGWPLTDAVMTRALDSAAEAALV